MRKAVIFDFDGVLVDSERHWPLIGPRIIARISTMPWSTVDQQQLVGHGMLNTHAILTHDYDVKISYPDYERIVRAEARSIYDTLTQPLPGAIDCLRRLSNRRIPLAVASSNIREMIDVAMERLSLYDFFDVTCSGDDVPGRSKPLPDVYLLAAKLLHIAPEHCVAIEDSCTGIMAAKAAGMHCIALHTQDNAKQDLSAADTHINGLQALTNELLDSLLHERL